MKTMGKVMFFGGLLILLGGVGFYFVRIEDSQQRAIYLTQQMQEVRSNIQSADAVIAEMTNLRRSHKNAFDDMTAAQRKSLLMDGRFVDDELQLEMFSDLGRLSTRVAEINSKMLSLSGMYDLAVSWRPGLVQKLEQLKIEMDALTYSMGQAKRILIAAAVVACVLMFTSPFVLRLSGG